MRIDGARWRPSCMNNRQADLPASSMYESFSVDASALFFTSQNVTRCGQLSPFGSNRLISGFLFESNLYPFKGTVDELAFHLLHGGISERLHRIM